MLAYPVSEEDVPDSHAVICAPRLRRRSQAAPKADDTCEGVISWDRIDPTIGGFIGPARAPRQQEVPADLMGSIRRDAGHRAGRFVRLTV